MLLKERTKIVFAGDSVTDDGRARPIGELGNALGNGFVHMVDTMLTVKYPERYIRCVNMGISGNTTKDLLNRWENDINALSPDLVVLCIGFNDVWRQFDTPCQPEWAVSPEEYRKNLNKMADLCKCNMLWLTPYYLETNKEDPMRKRMDEYRNICKQIAEQRGFICIDLQDEFESILKYRYPAFITWDRIHPGWVGSYIIAQAILRQFE